MPLSGDRGPWNGGPIPLTVVTGFLGVGKTTFLNRMLRDPALAGTAVIVNEFGEIGLDHLLMEAVAGDMLVLTTGCICCAARGDLLAAIDGLMERRRATGLRFDRIVVETTGIADPGPILNAVLLGPVLSGAVSSEGVVTLVSAVDGEAVLHRHDEARRQVALADRILITKADLADDRAIASLRIHLGRLNPFAAIGFARDAVPPLAGPAAPPARQSVEDGAHHHHGHDAPIRATILTAGLVDAVLLARFIALLQARYGAALLRLKGMAALRHDPDRPAIVQAVGHLLHPAWQLPAWPDPDRRTRLVVITDGVDPADVTTLWDEFFGPPAIDRPDAAARMDGGGAGLFG